MQLTKIHIFFIATLAFIIGTLLYVARNKLRQQGRDMNVRAYYDAMANLSKYFPSEFSVYYSFLDNQPTFVGKYLGNKFKLTFWRSDVVGPPPSKLILSCYNTSTSKLKIFIYRKDPGTVLFAKRICTEDSELDQFFIYSNKPDEAKLYFHDSSRRTAVKQIVENGWEPPMITGKKITAEAGIKRSELDPDCIKTILNIMITLQY